MLKFYVCFVVRRFLGEDSEIYRKIASKDIFLIGDIPDGVDYLRFCSREELDHEGEMLIGKYKNYSEKIGIGEVITISDLRGRVKEEHIEEWGYSKYSRFIWTTVGMAIPIKDGDIEGQDYIVR